MSALGCVLKPFPHTHRRPSNGKAPAARKQRTTSQLDSSSCAGTQPALM